MFWSKNQNPNQNQVQVNKKTPHRGVLVTRDSLLVTRDRPPRRLRQHPSAEGNFFPRRYGLGSPLWRGGTIPGPAKMQFSWVFGPGWSVIHRPYRGQHIPVTRTRQCPPPHTGPHANFVCAGPGVGRGVARPARRGVGIRVTSHPVTKKTGHRPVFYFASSSGMTETVFRSPRPRLNFTMPAIFANNVWSLPIPTFRPG